MKKQLALSLIWLCLTPFVALGQEFRATITGRVLDPNNAAVASATVTARNPRTNEAVSVTTNADGVYNIPFLQPGSYNITVEAAGFKKYVRDNQELQVGQTASIDVTLEVGAASETVTITGDAPLLEETKADRGNVIENRRIVELPLNARNPFMLSTLTPGITYNGPAIYQRPFDNGAIADWSINGGLNRSNEFLLDGAPNNSIQGGNNIAYVPPVDAVGESKIIWVRDQFMVCDGMHPNVICPNRINPIAQKLLAFYPKPNNVSPGSEPWRSNFADIPNIANDKFKNWIFKIDQNIGEKDKVFFRYGYNNRAEIRWTNGITSGPAQDGQLPLNRINYAGVADLVHTFSANTILNIRVSSNRYIEEARFQDGLGYDVTQLGFPAGLAAQLPTPMFPRINLYSTGTTVEVIQLGRGSFSREPTNVYSVQPNLTYIRGAHNMRFGLDMRYSQYARLISGNGGMVLTFNRAFTQEVFDRFDPNSGSSVASMLIGAVSVTDTGGTLRSFVDNNVFPIYMFKYYAPWFQDDWKVTRKLTLNFGLRFDLNQPGVERYGRINAGFDTTTVNPANARIDKSRLINGSQIVGGLLFADKGEAAVKTDKNNWQPRVGFAYSIGDKTVLRGGYGRYYVNPVGAPGYPNNGFSVQTPLIASTDGNRTPLPNLLSNPFPQGVLQPAGSNLGLESFLGLGFQYSNPNFVVPKVDNFSLGIQRQLPWNIAAEVSYVGSRTYDAQSQFNGINEPSQAFRDKCDVTKGGNRNFCNEQLPNPFFRVAGFSGERFNNATLSRYELMRPFPQFGAINELERNEGRVWYNSLQVLVNKRLSRGLSLNSTYTFSKTIEEAIQQPGQQDNTASYIDDVARIKNRSLAFSDRPHRLTLSGVWELPFGKGRKYLSGANRFVDLFVGGWQAAGLYVFNSGRPWQFPGDVEIVDPDYDKVESKRFRNGVELIQGVRPCVAQSGKLLDFSVAAGCTAPSFVIREPFQTRFTPIRSDKVRRPSFQQFDMNFSKTFRITERVRFQFRGEAYNVFNTPMYDERAYLQNTNNNIDFGAINKNEIRQSNFPRFWQLGLKVLF